MEQPVITVEKMDRHRTHDLDSFFEDCRRLGYKNNTSLKILKWDHSEIDPQFWTATVAGRIFAISGYHYMNELDAFRIAYRSCMVSPGYQLFNSYFSKAWWRCSFIFNRLLPLQVQELSSTGKDLFITTNVKSRNCSEANKVFGVDEKMMPGLESVGAVEYSHSAEYFHCLQNFWKVVPDKMLGLVSENKGNFSHKVEVLVN